MLTLSKIYAVKTGTAPFYNWQSAIGNQSHLIENCQLHIANCLLIYLPQPNQSFPLAYNINNNNKIMPATCAYSMNFSFGFLPLTISYSVNITCPPSKAGIGSRFINARMMDKKAVIFQNASQLQSVGKTEPIALNPPTPLYAPVSGFKISLNWSI